MHTRAIAVKRALYLRCFSLPVGLVTLFPTGLLLSDFLIFKFGNVPFSQKTRKL